MIAQLAAEAWAFRARVEREAAARFSRLAEEIAAFDLESPVPALLRRAADDERRHESLCAELAGVAPSSPPPGAAPKSPPPGAAPTSPPPGDSSLAPTTAGDGRIAPRSLGPREAALYEMVASCCITETESVATVASLLAEDAEPRVREVLHQIARDEVTHAQMGWAHLAREATAIDVRFLSRWLPSMLAGAAGDQLFTDSPPPETDSAELLRHGVLPLHRKRDIFAQTLDEVIYPGLEQFGISTAPAREWHAAQLAGIAAHAHS